jgi:hypothetical protein
MRPFAPALFFSTLICIPSIAGDYRILDDHGGSLDSYKAKYFSIRDRGDRVVIDGTCDSACTLVLGIVPLNRICATRRASLGFHMPYFDLAATDGVKVLSYQGEAEFMSYYAEPVRQWLDRNGGLTADPKYLKSGPELWAVIAPCPEEVSPVGVQRPCSRGVRTAERCAKKKPSQN